jgi:hypothetical protein
MSDPALVQPPHPAADAPTSAILSDSEEKLFAAAQKIHSIKQYIHTASLSCAKVNSAANNLSDKASQLATALAEGRCPEEDIRQARRILGEKDEGFVPSELATYMAQGLARKRLQGMQEKVAQLKNERVSCLAEARESAREAINALAQLSPAFGAAAPKLHLAMHQEYLNQYALHCVAFAQKQKADLKKKAAKKAAFETKMSDALDPRIETLIKDYVSKLRVKSAPAPKPKPKQTPRPKKSATQPPKPADKSPQKKPGPKKPAANEQQQRHKKKKKSGFRK